MRLEPVINVYSGIQSQYSKQIESTRISDAEVFFIQILENPVDGFLLQG